MIRLTSLIASSPTARASAARSCSATVSNWKESGLMRGPPDFFGPASSRSLRRTSAELKSSNPIATGTICMVCSVRRSSASAALSRGFTIATVRTLPASFTGKRRKTRISFVGTVASTDGERSKSRSSANATTPLGSGAGSIDWSGRASTAESTASSSCASMSVISSGVPCLGIAANSTTRSVSRFASASDTMGTLPSSPCRTEDGSQSTRDASLAITK